MTFTQEIERRKREVERQRSHVDLQLNAATLMLSVIRADGDTDDLELAQMVNILRTRYALSGDEISSLIASARQTKIGDRSLELLAEKLCQHWAEKERKKLLIDLWYVATADREIKTNERLVIELIANNLQLESEDIAGARYQAEQRLELNRR